MKMGSPRCKRTDKTARPQVVTKEFNEDFND